MTRSSRSQSPHSRCKTQDIVWEERGRHTQRRHDASKLCSRCIMYYKKKKCTQSHKQQHHSTTETTQNSFSKCHMTSESHHLTRIQEPKDRNPHTLSGGLNPCSIGSGTQPTIVRDIGRHGRTLSTHTSHDKNMVPRFQPQAKNQVQPTRDEQGYHHTP